MQNRIKIFTLEVQMAKKYYYLKLKDNFFENDEMVALESIPDGYKYSLVYLKLLAKSDYYKRGYRYRTNKYFDDTMKYLSIALKIALDEVKETIPKLVSMGLVKFEGNKIITKDININLDRDRCCKEYKTWRTSIFENNDYTCAYCGVRGGKLNAHHIKPWAKYPKLRYEVSNGITLCETCHRVIHKGGGKNS